MSVFVIADLHLSTDSESKSMEVFGNRWKDYQNRIKNNWNKLIAPNDTVIVPGDISWALTLQDSLSDLLFLDSLAGKKIIMKGNHDFWWSSVTKMKAMFENNNITSIEILNNNAISVENYIVTGSRGWFIDPSTQTKNVNADFDKVINRETIRLKMCLDDARRIQLQSENVGNEIIAFFHFPPKWGEFKNQKTFDLLKEYGIKRCYFGHIHGNYNIPGTFEEDNIKMRLISADYLNFIPLCV
jgi:predicted phosphohydrolase